MVHLPLAPKISSPPGQRFECRDCAARCCRLPASIPVADSVSARGAPVGRRARACQRGVLAKHFHKPVVLEARHPGRTLHLVRCGGQLGVDQDESNWVSQLAFTPFPRAKGMIADALCLRCPSAPHTGCCPRSTCDLGLPKHGKVNRRCRSRRLLDRTRPRGARTGIWVGRRIRGSSDAIFGAKAAARANLGGLPRIPTGASKSPHYLKG